MDFSKHVFSQANGTYSLETAPGTKLYAVIFHNVGDKCFVTGDYGSWVLSREWHPGSEWGFVSPDYFAEKVESVPRYMEAPLFVYNEESTRRNIQEDEEIDAEKRDILLGLSEDERRLRGAMARFGMDFSNVSYKLQPYLQTILEALTEMIKRSQEAKQQGTGASGTGAPLAQ